MSFNIADYNYPLPADRIADFPLTERDAAKMLVYKHGEILHTHFRDLAAILPADSLMVFNNTKVVQARLFFKRATGALIEVFCLKPIAPHQEISQAMQQQGYAIWECMAGNQKRWKPGESLELDFGGGQLKATLLEKLGREVRVQFGWQPASLSFADVLERAGKLPLPPYIHREPTEQDKLEYQTVYAREQGAVAAPTAGLHISERLLADLEQKGIPRLEVTLHVSAGTFQPVEAEDVREHPMHHEQIVFDRKTIESLRDTERKVVAVGTTSMRALESLYWFGQMLKNAPDVDSFFIPKLQPYGQNTGSLPSLKDSMNHILTWMDKRGLDKLWGLTEIFIMPGYRFQVCKGLITNFHLPQSTLLMLVAAFVGPGWKKVYDEALMNDYRFLSYGDGSLLLPV